MKKLLAVILSLLIGCSELIAALDVRTVWEVNTSATAGNVNGGGFNPFATANMLTDLACTSATGASPVCSSASYNFVAGDVGHWLYVVIAGNYTANLCQIASVASNQATLTAGVGTCNVIANPYWTTNTSAGIANTASPTGGTWSIDYSRSTAAVQTTTEATNTAGVITIGSLTYGKQWVGNVVQIVGGAGATVGWYEITDAVAATSFTLDRDPSGTLSIDINLGGAISLGSATANRTDDVFFELGSGTNGTGASRFFVKTGTYATLQAVSIASACGTQAPCRITGYNSVRGDINAAAPSLTSVPIFNAAANAIALGTDWIWENFSLTGTGSTVLTLGVSGRIQNFKVVNTSTSTARNAINMGNTKTQAVAGEAVSYLGNAINIAAATDVMLFGVWAHHSSVGLNDAGTTIQSNIANSIFSSNVTAQARTTGAVAGRQIFQNVTFFGAADKLGVCLDIATGATNITVLNSHLIGCTTGIVTADTQTIGYDFYNNYQNNTADVNGWQKGPLATATDPVFTAVSQVTFTTATYAGTTLTCGSCDFSGVTANVDYVLVKSGTSLTRVNSIGLVTAKTATTLVTDIDFGESGAADWTGHVTYGNNFLPTVTITGYPGVFPAGLTTGYVQKGAAPRQNQTSAGGGGIIGQ